MRVRYRMTSVLQRVCRPRVLRLKSCLFAILSTCLVGCADLPMEHPQLMSVRTVHVISGEEAAQRAAQEANTACDGRFHTRPFLAGQHVAVIKDGRYRWGGYDENNPKELSALVL